MLKCLTGAGYDLSMLVPPPLGLKAAALSAQGQRPRNVEVRQASAGRENPLPKQRQATNQLPQVRAEPRTVAAEGVGEIPNGVPAQAAPLHDASLQRRGQDMEPASLTVLLAMQ